MKTVIVGSKNPVKINSVRHAFDRMFPGDDFTFEGISAPSGVSDQPMGDEETYLGAKNRAAHCRSEQPDADYWVGIEGGCGDHEGDMEAFAWVVVLSGTKQGKARTSSFYLPAAMKALVDQGHELGVADDIVFNRKNAKQSSGAVGLLTGDQIDRTGYYRECVILALIPFKNPDLY